MELKPDPDRLRLLEIIYELGDRALPFCFPTTEIIAYTTHQSHRHLFSVLAKVEKNFREADKILSESSVFLSGGITRPHLQACVRNYQESPTLAFTENLAGMVLPKNFIRVRRLIVAPVTGI